MKTSAYLLDTAKEHIEGKSSNDQGRAYEYAWMQTLYKAIAELRKTRIVENSSLVANEKAWSLMDEDMQEIFMTSAGAAIDMVLELEPRMAEVDSDELTLEFQKDGQGVKGDVTMIHTFNMHDTLNKPAKNKVSAITVPIVKLPTRLVALEFKPGSDNTVEMYLDNGWQLSFRIHNASTKVEPSLKFDVQFVSMPMEVLNIECRWN